MKKYLILLTILFSSASFAEELPLEYFTQLPQFTQIRISPDGKYFAAIAPNEEGKKSVAIIDREKKAIINKIEFRANQEANSVTWANNERVLIQIIEASGSLSPPNGTGELFAVNFDGTKKKQIWGYRTGNQKSNEGSRTRKAKSKPSAASIENLLRHDPRKIIVSSYSGGGGRDGTPPEAYELDIYSGLSKRLGKAPKGIRNGGLIIDDQANIRVAAGSDLENQFYLYYRDDNKAEWQLIDSYPQLDGGGMSPVALTKDGKTMYLSSDRGAKTNGLVKYDIATKKQELLFRNERVDIGQLIWDGASQQPIGVRYEPDYPKNHFFEKDNRWAKIVSAIEQQFPDHWINISSMTWDGKEAVISVASDRNPGDFYLFERDTNKMTYLMSPRPWIKPEMMAETMPFQLKARDGVELHGYLTLPNVENATNLPMIVHPHGGPHGPRDSWGYSNTVQVLANRGYAVLQVNFRGSGGYGADFTSLGYRNWGTTMQDDVTDATLWAVKEGYADRNRICLFGASYGGYATLQGLVREPDLYQCGVSYVGVSDLPMMFTKGDIQTRRSGQHYLKYVLGEDQEDLKSRSPSHNADKIKVPVFFVHGGRDERVPIEQAEVMRDALEDLNKPFEWFVAPREGHGFYKPENNMAMYKRLFTFLDKHLGASRTASAGN